MRSRNGSPWFREFFAMETTSRRLDSTIFCLASRSPRSMRLARSTLLRGQQAHLADVLEEQLERVGRHVRPQVQRGLLGPAAAALVGRALHLVAGCDGRVDLLDQLDLLRLEEAVELLEVGLVEVELLRRLLDLGMSEHAELLSLGQ